MVYCLVAVLVFLGGVCIYSFFRNVNNMVLFNYFPKPPFLNNLYIPLKTDSIWIYMFIYNLPYGLWCLSGLLFVRTIWLKNQKWCIIYRSIFIFIVMSYVVLKLPGIIPGTFDVLDLIYMALFAFLESIFFNKFIRRHL